MSLFSPSSPGRSAEQTALDLGAYAAKVIEDYKNSQTDSFALRLAAEKANKTSAPKAVASRGAGGNRGRGGGKNSPLNRSDLKLRPFDATKVPKSVPRSGSSVFWVVAKVELGLISSSLTTIAENNYSFSLNGLPAGEVAAYQAIFDQFQIAQVSLTWASLEPPGGTGEVVVIHTAIDFDNVQNLGATSLLDLFGSSQVTTLAPGRSITRSCRPCVKSALGVVPSVNQSVERLWLDTQTSAGLPHYGLRSIMNQPAVAPTRVHVELTYWIAFRSTI